LTSNEIVRELAKLSTKMDIMCQEIQELKEFNRTAVKKLTILEERVKMLEEWKDEITRYNRLKKRFSYDLRSAIAGGIAGSIASGIFMMLLRIGGA